MRFHLSLVSEPFFGPAAASLTQRELLQALQTKKIRKFQIFLEWGHFRGPDFPLFRARGDSPSARARWQTAGQESGKILPKWRDRESHLVLAVGQGKFEIFQAAAPKKIIIILIIIIIIIIYYNHYNENKMKKRKPPKAEIMKNPDP